MTPWESFADGIGVFSANRSYHVLPRAGGRSVHPFVTGGYTMFFRDGTLNLWNIGGGVQYWFSDRIALRVEFRDHVDAERVTAQYWGVRGGLSVGKGRR
jgi:hypothetical protein